MVPKVGIIARHIHVRTAPIKNPHQNPDIHSINANIIYPNDLPEPSSRSLRSEFT